MLFQLYGETAGYQLLGFVLVFTGLVLANEFARRTKTGGIICFLALPAVLTVYFIAIYIGAANGAEWALNNQTYTNMNSWFHYAKLYAATAGCIGFMMLKYKWSIGKTDWFKVFPFAIVAINILIAVASDFESGIRGAKAMMEFGDRWWLSSENVWLYGGWWNWVNGIAGIINIFCMTAWWGIYSSKDKKDMLWPDMTWCYILAYDLWNFEYTYNCLPTHSWYCGIALLLAPTIAGLLWNKGGWIQNRAFTLSMWCMFCQMVPMFVNDSVFAVQSVNNPAVNTVVSVIALVANILALGYIIYRAKKLKVNPYKQEVFVGTKDFSKAMSRRADTAYLLETEPKSATPAEIAEMVAYNELPVDGEVGFVYVAKDRGEIDVDVETIKRE